MTVAFYDATMTLVRFASILIACSAALATWTPSAAHADTAEKPGYPAPPAPSLWKREWPTFSRLEGIATVAAGAGTGLLFVLKPPSDPRWEGGILFDDRVRSGLRLESEGARDKAAAWGDIPYYASPLIPLILDPLVSAWWVHGDRKAAINMTLVGLEAFSYAGLLSFVSTRVSARERPDSAECRRTHDNPEDCERDTESFYSGHTTIAAASAGIVCANHRAMPLWGSRAADVGACALATTSAVVGGVSRILSDRHYATDVIAGFGVGFGIGYAVPTLLHYSHDDTDVRITLSPGSPCTGACLKIAGSF